jgi:Holliday junction resolvase-like predicted endonuclease
MVFVTKFNGRKELFQKEKVVRTCMRMRASLQQARDVADKIESKLYEGIRTKEILKMIFRYMEEYRPEIKHEIDLKEAISLLRPKEDFEQFVRLILEEYGYRMRPNEIIKGKCVEHEIDAIAEMDGRTVMVEVKHHLNHHVYSGIEVCMVAQSRFEDLSEGFKEGLQKIKFDKVLIVCNTKFSDYAKNYADCKGMELIGWKMPLERGLEQMIERKKLYPITFLKDLDRADEARLGNAGIVLLKQLVETNMEKLHERTGISKNKLKGLVEKAREIVK